MKRIVAQGLQVATAFVFTGMAAAAYLPAVGAADTCAAAAGGAALPAPGPDVTPCGDVLGLEARWLTAITAGDRDTVASILNANYKHIDSSGRLINRQQEIAETVQQPFVMNATEQDVDLLGALAVIHGLNTITQSGKVLDRERFTDVFVNQNGGWTALSAQETKT